MVSAIAGAFNPLGGGAWSNMIARPFLDPVRRYLDKPELLWR